MESLTVKGTPCSGPSGAPLATAWSAASARSQGVFGHQGDDGVDLRVDRVDAVQVRLDDLARRHLPGADERRQRRGIKIVDGIDGFGGHGDRGVCVEVDLPTIR